LEVKKESLLPRVVATRREVDQRIGAVITRRVNIAALGEVKISPVAAVDAHPV
jgi:hypothetical protein